MYRTRAVVLHVYGGPEQLKFEDFADPIAGRGEVLIRVPATSVNPFDLKIRSGAVKDWVPLTFPAILGLDVSGVVEALWPDVEGFAPGDRVFAQVMQTYASLCVVKAADLAKVPDHMDLSEMATLPTVTTTGDQHAQLATGGNRRGAAGNVARSAVLTAKDNEWSVIAGVRKTQVNEAKALGADRVDIAGAVPTETALPVEDMVSARPGSGWIGTSTRWRATPSRDGDTRAQAIRIFAGSAQSSAGAWEASVDESVPPISVLDGEHDWTPKGVKV